MAKRPDRIDLVIPKALVKRAKVKALADDTTVSAVVRAFLLAWLEGRLQVPAGADHLLLHLIDGRIEGKIVLPEEDRQS